jgi:O-antigen ligase
VATPEPSLTAALPAAGASATAGSAAARPGPWLPRAQGAAIFAGSANLFSTALANVALAVFLMLFVVVLVSPERRQLAWGSFPKKVALALVLYLGWQAAGMLYTDAPLRWAWESLYADRKVLYILPLALMFATEPPRRRFLAAFLGVNVVALVASFVLLLPEVAALSPRGPNRMLHSHVTQGMSFAMACFLSLWYARQARQPRWRFFFGMLALAFLLNIVTVTVGRSGYVVFLVLVVVAFGFWRGPRGLVVGLVAAGVIAVTLFYASHTIRARVMLGVDEARNYTTAQQSSSLGIRMLLYHATAELIAQHPLLGGGTGSFKGHFAALVTGRYTGWKAAPFEDPHNQYLFVWVENGVLGLATFLFLLVALYQACDKRNIYGQMAAASLLAWCATSLFSGHFRTLPEGHMIVFVLGVLMVRMQPTLPAVTGQPAS